MSIAEYIEKFIETKQKLSDLEKKHEKYRKFIEEYMNSNNITNISQEINDKTYNIKKSVSNRQSISKKDVPPEIWSRYCKTSSFSVLNVSKV